MIKMGSIQIVNWHALTMYKPLPCGDICFLTGPNKSGKSTVFDALALLLYAKTDKFNMAAEGSKSGERTLVGYVRGLRSLSENEGKDSQYMRPGITSSHIAADFTNEKTGKYFTIGVAIDMKDHRDSDIPTVCWWLSEGHRIEDFSFFLDTPDGKRVKSMKELKESFTNGAAFWSTSVQKEARRRWSTKGVLGMTNVNMGSDEVMLSWVRNMRSATAYNTSEATNVHMYLKERFAPESIPEIEGFRDRLKAMNASREIFQSQSRRQAALGTIVDLFQKFEEQSATWESNKIAASCVRIAILEEKCTNLEQNRQRNRQKVMESEKKERDIGDRLNRVRSDIAALERDDKNAAIASLNAQKEMLDRKIGREKESLNEYQCLLIDTRTFAVLANSILEGSSLDVSRIDDLCQKGPSGEEDSLRKILNSLSNVQETLSQQQLCMRGEQSETRNRLQHIDNEIKAIKQKSVFGDKNAAKVKETICVAFKNNGISDVPYFLCELLEFRDPSWAEQVEAYMGSSRFAIIVAPENYAAAAQAYSLLHKTNKNIHGVTLVDTSYYKGKTFPINPGSVAEILETENPLAAAYVADNYGKVMLVEDASNPPDKQGIAIDRNSMRYARHGLSALRPIELVVGERARKIRLQKLEKERDDLQELLQQTQKQLSDIDRALSDYKLHVNRFVVQGLSLLTSIASLPSDEEQREKIIMERKQFENNPDYQYMLSLEDEERRLIQEQNAARAIAKEAQNNFAHGNYEHEQLTKELEAIRAQVEADRRTLPGTYVTGTDIAEKAMLGNRSIRFLSSLERRLMEDAEIAQNTASELDKQIAILQGRFCREFSLDFDQSGASAMTDYLLDYNNLTRAELPKLQAKAEEDIRMATIQFHDNILCGMRSGIAEYNRECTLINRILDRIPPIGDRKFRFNKVKARCGQEEIFDMISSESNQTYGDQVSLDNSVFDSEFEEVRTRFFASLLDAKSEEERKRIIDYREYCEFGVSVYSSSNPTHSNSLSNLFGTNSGSENQVPIYIILAAALCTQYNRNNSRSDPISDSDSCRLMFVDECFDKMDASNVKTLLSFIHDELGLQLIIAAPHDRYSKICGSIDTVWLMTDDKQGRTCTYFSKEKFLREAENAAQAKGLPQTAATTEEGDST